MKTSFTYLIWWQYIKNFSSENRIYAIFVLRFSIENALAKKRPNANALIIADALKIDMKQICRPTCHLFDLFRKMSTPNAVLTW